MATRTFLVCILSLAVAFLAAPGRAPASGLETSGIGARGRSMGYALTGLADDWSALYYNPAGLARLEGQTSACVYEFFTGENTASASLRNLPLRLRPDPARGDFADFIGDEPSSFRNREVGAVVHAGEFGWTRRRGEWGYGLGIFGSGAGSSWEDTVPLDSGGTLEGEVAFSNISINLPLALAWAPSKKLALGTTLNLRFGKLDADFRKVRTGRVGYRLVSEQKTSGYGAGLDLGLLWAPSPNWSFGAVWRLPAFIWRDGETGVENTLAGIDLSSGTSVEERIPSRVTAGGAYRSDGGAVMALAVTWLDWSAYDRKTTYDNEVTGVLENTSGNPFQWRDAFVVNLGAEVPVGGPWTIRGGLVWDQAPEPEEYRTLVGGQTLDVWKAALGMGWEGDGFSINTGYTRTWSADTEGYREGVLYQVSLHEFYAGFTLRH